MITIGSKDSWLWAIDAPTEELINRGIGRTFKVKDDGGREVKVTAERVTGCKAPQHKTKLQIDSNDKSYVISALDYFAQLNGEDIPEDMIKAFDETQFDVVPPPRTKGGIWLK